MHVFSLGSQTTQQVWEISWKHFAGLIQILLSVYSCMICLICFTAVAIHQQNEAQ